MQRVSPLPRTNQNWPEAFGFQIGGDAPVVITSVFEGSVAKKSGLRPGDQLLEVEGVNIQNLSKADAIALARQSKRVPPAICVISRIRTFFLRRKRGSFGLKVRGGGPVFVSQLDERGPAKVAGIRIGDVIVEINATSVREMTFVQVEQLINTSGSQLQLVLIAGVKSIEEIEQRNTASRFRKAREFFDEMNYYLAGEEKKKNQLVKLLNKFAKDKYVETLAKGLLKILETPVQKRLSGTIKQLIPRAQQKLFSDLLNNHGQTDEDIVGKGLSRSPSFGEQLDKRVMTKPAEGTSSKYRTWSKATSQSPYKTRLSLSPNKSPPQRPVSMTFDQPAAEATFQRSYSSSAAFPPRHSPEQLGEEYKSLAEKFKFQMNQFLTRGEQLVLKQRLKEYQKHRNAKELVSSLEPVLDDQEKLKMVPYLSHLLPPSEQNAFDKEAQKLMAKFLQGTSSAGPDVIDVAYRVQGLRLSESPQPKNVIGGIRDSELDVIPVKDTPSNATSNESATVAALLAAAENSKSTGNVITIKALVHSERNIDGVASEILNSSDLTSSWDHGRSKEVTRVDQADANNDQLQRPTTIQESAAAEKTIGEGKIKSTPRTQSDIFLAVEEQRENLAQKDISDSNDGVAPTLLPPTGGGGFAPPAPPPPPPPPPPGLNLKLGVGDDAPLPKMQLRRVNWEKLGVAGLENTVWGQLGRNDTLDQLDDFVELEQQFSSSKKPKATTVTKKQEKVEILEPRKQYNIAILLGHLKLPNEEIKKAVLSMDEKKLTESHVKQLLLYAPDHKEIQKYKHFADDEKKLGVSDRFSLMVSQIPGYSHRLKAMLFKARFSDKLDEIKPELETVVNASRQLRNSTKVQQVLQLVLAFGNYMNQGNARIAGASAFRIGFLAKLSSTKTSDNKSNLLKFLVKTVETKCPEVLDLKGDLNSISLAARVSYQMIKEEIDDVIKSMEDVKADLDKHGDHLPQNDDDKFTEIIGTFVQDSKKDMNTLLELHDQMKEEYNQTAKFFGEDPNMTSTEEFFGIFSTFIEQFENARVELISQKKKKEEQVKREIDKQNRLKKKKDPKSSRSLDGNEENLNNKDELSKRHEMIVNQNSSSSFDDDDLTFGSSLSTELQPDHTVDAAKKPPPPVLPKPKPKKKPKIPPKSPSRAAFVSPNAQTHTKREMAGQNAGDENYGDVCTDTTTDKNKVRVQRNIQRKPILLQQQQLQSAASDHPTVVNNSGHNFTRQDAVNDDDDIENALYSTVNFASLGFHKPYSGSVEPESPEPYAVSDVNHFNYDPKPSHREETSNRVLSPSKSIPAGHVGQDGHNAVQVSPTLGIKEVQSVMNGVTSYSVGENNDLYSLPVNNGRQDGHNMVQVSPTLGIKEVQSVMDGGTSYSVGENNDVYSLPVNNGRQDDQNMFEINSLTLGIKEVQSILKDGTSYIEGDNDIYSLPDHSIATDKDTRDSYGYPEPRELHKSEQESKLSTPSKEYETEEPYAETTICFQNSSPNADYEIPAPFVKTSPPHTPRRKTPLVDYISKPPNSKPPPPPPGNTPTFETKKKKRIPGFPKPPPLKDIAVTDSSQPPHAERQKFGRSDSSSSNESTNSKRDVEQIFASRSDIGFTEEDNNNNRHPVVPSPKRNIAYSPLDNHYTNAQDPSQISLNNIASDILIVPPPPPSTPILDSDAMVVPPPPPMSDNDTSHIPYSAVVPPPPIYPPPRLRSSERAQLYVGTTPKSYSQDDAESQWLDMVEGLPPPPPDLLEESPLY